MQKELRRIAPLRAGVLAGIVQGILAVPIYLNAYLLTLAAPNNPVARVTD